MNQKIMFEKIQNFDAETTEYVSTQRLSEEAMKQAEAAIYSRYAESADFKEKLEKLPSEKGRLNLRVKTEPESLIYSRLENDTAFIVRCEDFNLKWNVSNLLQISLAMAGYEIKDSKF